MVQRLEAQLVAGVRRIRDQLAQEDLLVRVQRVGDEVQDLLDFGLKGQGLFFHDRVESSRYGLPASGRRATIFHAGGDLRPMQAFFKTGTTAGASR